jgi:hypothetical protein
MKGERDAARSSYAEERMEACVLGRNVVDGFLLRSEGDPTRFLCGLEILKSGLTGSVQAIYDVSKQTDVDYTSVTGWLSDFSCCEGRTGWEGARAASLTWIHAG